MIKTKEKKVLGQVKLDPALKRLISAEALRLDIFEYELMRRMWGAYKAGEALTEVSGLKPANNFGAEQIISDVRLEALPGSSDGEILKAIQDLQAIRQSGDIEAWDAIKSNLSVFARVAQDRGSHGRGDASSADLGRSELVERIDLLTREIESAREESERLIAESQSRTKAGRGGKKRAS